jgi:hypothetical protein
MQHSCKAMYMLFLWSFHFSKILQVPCSGPRSGWQAYQDEGKGFLKRAAITNYPIKGPPVGCSQPTATLTTPQRERAFWPQVPSFRSRRVSWVGRLCCGIGPIPRCGPTPLLKKENEKKGLLLSGTSGGSKHIAMNSANCAIISSPTAVHFLCSLMDPDGSCCRPRGSFSG